MSWAQTSQADENSRFGANGLTEHRFVGTTNAAGGEAMTISRAAGRLSPGTVQSGLFSSSARDIRYEGKKMT